MSGGHKSGQTQLLTEACLAVVDTIHVESVLEITADLLKDKKSIGITAGSTTPDWLIDEVLLTLKAFFN